MTDKSTPTRDEAVRDIVAKYLWNLDDVNALCRELASAPAPASGRVDAVAVKALEWVKTIGGAYVAAAFDGHYQVAERIDDKGWNCSGPDHEAIALGVALHIAKAEAQADYERRSALSPAATPVSEAGGEIEAAQITMGRGLVDVTRIEHEGRAGILFRPRDQHIPIGDEGELQPGKYWPVAGDVVIWIENEGGAEVIREYLAPFLAKPASSPAGGDDLGTFDAWFAALDTTVIESMSRRAVASEAWHHVRRSLSQSTSAGRVE